MSENPFQLIDHLTASMCGAFVTSLFMTPMDVVKHRLQAQQAMASDYTRNVKEAQKEMPNRSNSISKIKLTTIIPESWTSAAPITVPTTSQSVLPSYMHSQSQNLTHYEEVLRRSSFVRMHTGIMDVWCPKCNQNPSMTPLVKYTGMLDAFRRIFVDEGIRGLWKGLSPTLLMALPNTAVYFTMYDYIHTQQRCQYEVHTSVAALTAGTVSRAFTSSLISPLEQLRTRAQTEGMTNPGKSTSISTSIQQAIHQKGLFRGLSATLWRDLPFSAVYWVLVDLFRPKMYEQFHMIDNPHTRQSLSSFCSGAIGGSVASLMTQPFDMIKTRRQITMFGFPGSSFGDASTCGTLSTMRNIIQEEGLKGQFQGTLPRMVKITLSCAIMISTYDSVKALLQEYRRKTNNKHI